MSGSLGSGKRRGGIGRDDCICAIKNNNLINNGFQVNMTYYYLHMDVRVLDGP